MITGKVDNRQVRTGSPAAMERSGLIAISAAKFIKESLKVVV